MALLWKKSELEKNVLIFLTELQKIVIMANFKCIDFTNDVEEYIMVNLAKFRASHPNIHQINGVNGFIFDTIELLLKKQDLNPNNRNIELLRLVLLKEARLNAKTNISIN